MAPPDPLSPPRAPGVAASCQVRYFRMLAAVSLAFAATVPPMSAVTYTQVDLSAHYNYDGVGTQDEIDYAATQQDGVNPYKLSDILGNHSLSNAQAYTPESSPGAGDGLPLNGSLAGGKYVISTAFDDSASGFSIASPNLVLIQANNTNTTITKTFTLSLAEQGQYDAFNLAFAVQRSANANGFTSEISVSYTDASSEVVLLTTHSNVPSTDAVRGVFGSNNFQLISDSYTFENEAPDGGTISLSNLVATTDYLGLTGSGASQRSLIRSGTSSLWEFSQDLSLDSSKTLESITIELTRGGVNRDSNLFLAGATLVVIPEPGTSMLVASAGFCTAMLRRRRLPLK